MQRGRNVFLLLRRYQTTSNYFSMENLIPPVEVRGMKVLEKGLFEKVVRVPCVILKVNVLKEALKQLKPYMLKLPAFNSVRVRDETFKEILLDPNIINSFEDFCLERRKALSNLGEKINFEYVDVRLGYDNWKASDVLNSVIPKEVGSVRGYSIIGHIVHLNLKSELQDYRDIIGKVLLDKIPQAKTVVNKTDIIDNEFRTFQLEVLAGVEDFMVQVMENRCIFKFDFSKVYWNPRLGTEHFRVVENLSSCDVLYDAFAGVGPFSIPAAKRGCTVLANDLNNEAVSFLRENIRLNKVDKYIVVSQKDAREFIQHDFKTHFINLQQGDFKAIVTMNLPALAPKFLQHFKGLYSTEDVAKLNILPTPLAYVYCFIKGESDASLSARLLISESLDMELEDEIDSVTFVRKVAPNKEMMRVTLRLTPRILTSNKRTVEFTLNEPCKKKSNNLFLSQEEEKKDEKSEEK